MTSQFCISKFKIHVNGYSELSHCMYILRTVLCLRGGAFFLAPPLSAASIGEHFTVIHLKFITKIQSKFDPQCAQDYESGGDMKGL